MALAEIASMGELIKWWVMTERAPEAITQRVTSTGRQETRGIYKVGVCVS